MKSSLMKLLGAPLSMAILLSGCSSDLTLPEPEKPMERDTDFYINVKIAAPVEETTRAEGNTNTAAGDYVNGTKDEQAIHKILFVFYNSVNEYVGNATYVPSQTSDGKDQTAQDAGDAIEQGKNVAGSIETIMNITVPVTVAAGSTKPAYVMAYVNPTNKAENDLFDNYYTALGAFRSLNDVRETNDHKGFAMNNSVYYDSRKNDLPVIAAPIEESQLFTSLDDAKKATEDETTVVIYVERIVAKVTLNQDEEISESKNEAVDSNNNTYKLKFEALGWGLSNLEQYTFLVKNFRTEDAGNPQLFSSPMSFTNFTYNVLNGRLATQGGLTNPSWNFPSYTGTDNWGISGHRTFWALSPTYYSIDKNDIQIPTYADEIYFVDEDDSEPTVHQAKSPLIYRSFNDIYDTGKAEAGEFGEEIGNHSYTLEHTMQASLVTNYQKRAVTCAVVAGKYSIKDKDGKDVDFDNFYISKKMTESGPVHIIYISDEEMKKAYLNANSTIYVENPAYTEGGKEVKYIPANAESLDDFVIEHPREDILGEGNMIASRYVTIKLANAITNKYYRQTASGSTYEPVTTANLLEVNKELYENMIGALGGIEKYHQGYAYFEVPVRHLWGRSNKGIGEKDFSARLGQYGIVRNHSYTINVQAIEGIGIGLSDPDAPIVPNVDNDDYAVKAEIRVQRWRVVPVQNVTLKP